MSIINSLMKMTFESVKESETCDQMAVYSEDENKANAFRMIEVFDGVDISSAENGYLHDPKIFPSKDRFFELLTVLSETDGVICRIYDEYSRRFIYRGNLWNYMLNVVHIDYNVAVRLSQSNNGVNILKILDPLVDLTIDKSLVNFHEYLALQFICSIIAPDGEEYLQIEEAETLLIVSGLESRAKLFLVPFPPQKVESMFSIKDGVMTTLFSDLDQYVKRYEQRGTKTFPYILNVKFEQ